MIFTTKELAEYLGISVRTIFRRLDSIPHFKVLGNYRFRKDKVDKWLQQYSQ